MGSKTWRAYLSVERDADNGNRPTDARSRIGNGPWFNAKGVMVASNVTELHTRKGDSTVFVDERGQPINGQWTGSPAPVEHDIMTGSAADGTLLTGFTCGDWTSAATTAFGQVGHSDGLGPDGETSGRPVVLEFGACECELRIRRRSALGAFTASRSGDSVAPPPRRPDLRRILTDVDGPHARVRRAVVEILRHRPGRVAKRRHGIQEQHRTRRDGTATSGRSNSRRTPYA